MHRMHSKAATDSSLIFIVGWREEEVLYDLNKDQYPVMPQNTQEPEITIFNQYKSVAFFEKKINTSALILPPLFLFSVDKYSGHGTPDLIGIVSLSACIPNVDRFVLIVFYAVHTIYWNSSVNLISLLWLY